MTPINRSFEESKITYFLIFLAVLILRSFYTEPIESGSDPIEKWNYVLNFWNTPSEFLKNHHTMRWAVNFWGVVAVFLFGNQPSTYYLGTLFFFALGYTILFYFYSRFAPRWSYIVFLIFLFYEPMMFRASSQFQPIVFGFTYLALSLLFYEFWSDSKRKTYLFLSAFSMFLAYGSKEPYLYFLPGLLLFIYLKKGKTITSYYFLIFSLLFSIEYCIFNFLSDKFLVIGRLSAILATHIPGGGVDRGWVYFDYVKMWSQMSWFDSVAVLSTILFLSSSIMSRKLEKIPNSVLAFSFMFLSYLLLNMTLIVNFDSMLTSQAPLIKYLAVAMPFACFSGISFLILKIEQLRIERALTSITVWINSVAFIFLFFQIYFSVGPKYVHQGIEYPAPNFYISKVNSQVNLVSKWLNGGNGIYTYSWIKAATLRNILASYSDIRGVTIKRSSGDKYLVYKNEFPIEDLKATKDFHFSVYDFSNIPINQEL